MLSHIATIVPEAVVITVTTLPADMSPQIVVESPQSYGLRPGPAALVATLLAQTAQQIAQGAQRQTTINRRVGAGTVEAEGPRGVVRLAARVDGLRSCYCGERDGCALFIDYCIRGAEAATARCEW